MRTIAPLPWPAEPADPEPFRVLSIRIETRDDARAALREVLAAHAGVEAAAVRIDLAPCVHCGEPHGKPYLAEPGGRDLRFNLSHTKGLALIALARGREVGVDVEAMRSGRRTQAIAERHFTDAEADSIRTAPDPDAAFYRLWTRKEAYLKATAAGYAAGLHSFEALAPEPPGWELADVDAGPGYAAALALAPPGYIPGG